MKLESYGRSLDADIEKDYERKGLYNDSSSFAYDWYGLSNCEPIDENMQDTIDKLQHLERECKFGTAVELFDLKQLFEQSENVNKIMELADKKLQELQKTSPSKAQKLQELLEQAHTSDKALNNAIIQRVDRDEEIAKARAERKQKQETYSTYSAYDSISKSIDDEFKRKWEEMEQSVKARNALKEAEDNLRILAQLEKDPDGITSAALESFIRIYQEQIAQYQSVLGVDSKNFDAQFLREQKSRIDAKIEELKVKFYDEIELESQPEVVNDVEIEGKERIEAERKAKEEAEAKAKEEQTRREEADAKAKAEEKFEAEKKAKEEAEAKSRIEEERKLAEKKAAELEKAEARAKAENEWKIEQANNMYRHDIAKKKAAEEKQSLSTEELETIQQVEQSLREIFGDGFDITRLRIESEQDFKNELSQKFGLQGLQDASEIQKKLQDMIYEGNILGADIRTPQGLRRYQLFKQVIPNFEELKSKVLQIRGYDISLEDKLFEGIDLSNISYDSILQRADSIIQEQVDLKNQDKATEMIRPQEESIRDEVGDEFEPETEAQQQERKDAEIEWMQRIGSVAQEVDKTNAGVKGKQEVVKLTQDLQAREKQEQIKLQEEQDQQSH